MTEQDSKNYKVIRDLVDNYFSLRHDSFKRFTDAMEKPPMVPYIAEMFKDSQDMRLRFPLESEEIRDSDESWKLFAERFDDFRREYDLKYVDFLNNKVTINKSKVKLKKALMSYYLSNTDKARWGLDKTLRETQLDRNYFTRIISSYRQKVWEIGIEACSIKDLNYFSTEKECKDEFTKILDVVITKTMEKIGTIKTTQKSLEVVFTRNFADWFMASTGESSWTSCIDLNSDYESVFWSGLPGTIVDPNRVMIYVTDGKKKSYKGIEVDRYLQRSWAVLDDEEKLHQLIWYESKKIKNKTIAAASGLPLCPNSGKPFTSMVSFQPLFFVNDCSCFIYHDHSHFSRPDEYGNVFIEGSEDSDACMIDQNGQRMFEPAWYFDEAPEYGLYTLIENDMTLSEFGNYSNAPVCTCCGERIHDEDEVRYAPDRWGGDEVYCEECFNDTFTYCESCNEVIRHDDARCDNEGTCLCDSCADDSHIIDGKFVDHDDCAAVYDPDGDEEDYEFNWMKKDDVPDSFVYVKDLLMWFPEDMCEYIESDDEWWTHKMIAQYNDNDNRQYKFEFDKKEPEGTPFFNTDNTDAMAYIMEKFMGSGAASEMMKTYKAWTNIIGA